MVTVGWKNTGDTRLVDDGGEGRKAGEKRHCNMVYKHIKLLVTFF